MSIKPEEIATSITTSINSHTHIHDASHVTVDAKTTGFMFWKKTEIHVSGRVDTDREKDAIDEIVKAESAGIPVVSNIRVQRR